MKSKRRLRCLVQLLPSNNWAWGERLRSPERFEAQPTIRKLMGNSLQLGCTSKGRIGNRQKPLWISTLRTWHCETAISSRPIGDRSEEHTSELQSRFGISY